MDIDRCNSIFELFAAFNFTYAVLAHPDQTNTSDTQKSDGKSFVDVIESYLVKPYDKLLTKAAPYEQKIIGFKESIDTITKSSNDPDVLIDTESLGKQINGAEYLIKTWIDRVLRKKQDAKEKINGQFPFASFLLALFCLAVLILATSESKHKHFTLLLFDLILFYLSFVYLIAPNYKNLARFSIPLSYRNILRSFFIGIIIISIVHLFLKYYFSPYKKNIYDTCTECVDKNLSFLPFLIILNIIVPFIHYIIYYGSFSLKIKSINKDADNKFEMVEEIIEAVENKHNELEKKTRGKLKG